MIHALSSALLVLSLAATALPQMEKRWTGRYDGSAFARAAPAIGARSPDFVLRDLDGRPWALSSLLGRTVVLVKGSFT